MRHAWNSPFVLENHLTFNVLIHSGHHLGGVPSFHERLLPGAPLTPLPQLALMLAAFVPSLYTHVMRPRAEAVAAAGLG